MRWMLSVGRRIGAVLCVCAAVGAARAADDADGDGGPKPVPAAEILDKMMPRAVRVFVAVRRDDGLMPEQAPFNIDMLNERPTAVGGYWWDAEGRVVVTDPILPGGFVRHIRLELKTGGGEAVAVPAVVDGYHPTARLLLLKPRGPLPAGVVPAPLAFAAKPERKAWGKTRTFLYQFDGRDDWVGVVGPGVERLMRREAGGEFVTGGAFTQGGVLVDARGNAVGFPSLNPLPVDDKPDPASDTFTPWWGADLKTEDFIAADALARFNQTLRARLADAAPEVRLHFRQQIEDDEEEASNRYRGDNEGDDDGVDDDAVEYRATGFKIADGRLFVPVTLSRELIAKLESIDVRYVDGPPVEGVFDGALRHFHGLFVKTETRAGDPVFTVGARPAPSVPGGAFFVRARVDHTTGRRKERFDYDRYLGHMPQYRAIPGVQTFTNEKQGDLAVDPRGTPLALAVGLRRPDRARAFRYYVQTGPALRPLAHLSTAFAAPDAVDETLVPKPKDEERRLVAFGVEAQGLNVNLAKWFGAEAASRGGQIGMLVTYVYPGSPAERIGLREHDVLLRLTPPDRAEPLDLAGGSAMPWYNMIASDADALRHAERDGGYMPPPWPSPQNRLTDLLTAFGPGREVTLEYVRAGEIRRAAFTTEPGPPDFQSAPKHRSRVLGLTAKPVTYEVARFFKRAEDAGGVVLAHVETGEKAQVAGLGAYMLVTRVDGAPVADLDDFKAKIAPDRKSVV